jgi:hypothetical protein
MPIDNKRVFDTKDVLDELNIVLQKGLNEIVDRFINKFNLYEETHNYVMNAPFIKKLLIENPSRQEESIFSTTLSLNAKIDALIKENERLKAELQKFKPNENISLKIVESDNQQATQSNEKMYEKIMNSSEGQTKKIFMNNMFKVVETNESTSDEISDSESESEDESGKEEEEASKEEDASKEEEEEEEEEEEDEEDEEDSEKEEDSEEEEEEEEEEEDEEDEGEEEEEKEEEEKETATADMFEIEIDDVTYFTNDEEDGYIHAVDKNGKPGKKVGYLKDGEPFF